MLPPMMRAVIGQWQLAVSTAAIWDNNLRFQQPTDSTDTSRRLTGTLAGLWGVGGTTFGFASTGSLQRHDTFDNFNRRAYDVFVAARQELGRRTQFGLNGRSSYDYTQAITLAAEGDIGTGDTGGIGTPVGVVVPFARVRTRSASAWAERRLAPQMTLRTEFRAGDAKSPTSRQLEGTVREVRITLGQRTSNRSGWTVDGMTRASQVGENSGIFNSVSFERSRRLNRLVDGRVGAGAVVLDAPGGAPIYSAIGLAEAVVAGRSARGSLRLQRSLGQIVGLGGGAAFRSNNVEALGEWQRNHWLLVQGRYGFGINDPTSASISTIYGSRQSISVLLTPWRAIGLTLEGNRRSQRGIGPAQIVGFGASAGLTIVPIGAGAPTVR